MISIQALIDDAECFEAVRALRWPDSDRCPARSSDRPGGLIDTDEYDIYARLPEWGFCHETVRHAAGEYARDDDGVREVHVNTLEGLWSLLRSWLRPRRGISQERRPLYLGFFEFVHNARRRGRVLLNSLLELLVAPPRNPG